jgi:hypothetical protein
MIDTTPHDALPFGESNLRITLGRQHQMGVRS